MLVAVRALRVLLHVQRMHLSPGFLLVGALPYGALSCRLCGSVEYGALLCRICAEHIQACFQRIA